MILGGQTPSPALWITPVVFLALFPLVMSYKRTVAARAQIDNLRKAGDTLVTYRFDEEGFVLRSAGASSSVAYRLVVRSRLGKRTLLLYTNSRIAQFIPRRAFSEPDLARVMAWLPKNQKASVGSPAQRKRVVFVWILLIVAFGVIWKVMSSDEDAARPTRHRSPRTSGSSR